MGPGSCPQGSDYYAARLKHHTTTDWDAERIHALGLAEVERLHSEMRAIQAQVQFEGTLRDFFEHLRTDASFFYPNDTEGKAAYLAAATALIDTMRQRLPEVFNTLPEAQMVVRAVEPYREKSAGKAFYSAPAPDGSRPGVYYANLHNTLDMPIYQMEALAYHEGIPGHHMQIAIAQELENVPRFRRFAGYTAYSEGWGLYSEFLPKEMGFYADPYSDFGRLAMELWRACRLVVDTGIHHKQWTRERAIEYLAENTPNPLGDCQKAIERYIVMPGQATAYKVGMNRILELPRLGSGRVRRAVRPCGISRCDLAGRAGAFERAAGASGSLGFKPLGRAAWLSVTLDEVQKSPTRCTRRSVFERRLRWRWSSSPSTSNAWPGRIRTCAPPCFTGSHPSDWTRTGLARSGRSRALPWTRRCAHVITHGHHLHHPGYVGHQVVAPLPEATLVEMTSRAAQQRHGSL